jgi:hypothetical protein
MSSSYCDLQEVAVIESLPLRQIPSKSIQQRELHRIGPSHHMTDFVPGVVCLGVT